MICRLIPRRYSLYMLFWLFLSAFFTFSFTSNSFAYDSSYSCSFPGSCSWYVSSPTESYLTISASSIYSSNSNPKIVLEIYCISYSNINLGTDFKLMSFSPVPIVIPLCVDSSTYYIRVSSINTTVNFGPFPSDYSLNFSLTDTLSSGITPEGSLSITENGTYDVTSYSEAVVEVSAPPSTYHEDLANINHSITVCAAVILVLYFFYCIYRLIIKNSGVH